MQDVLYSQKQKQNRDYEMVLLLYFLGVIP